MRIIDLATLSLTGGSGIAEAKIPLWCGDGIASGTSATTSGSTFLEDGAGLTTTAGSARAIFTLSSNWPSSEKYALEVSAYTSNTNTAAQISLWDITTGALAGSMVSTTSATMNVVRSAQFALTPNHQYGITVWGANGSLTYYISDASLIIFP